MNVIDDEKSLSELDRKKEEYIEKRINALSIYNVYWCLFELRSRARLPAENILKDDSFCKLQLIRILKKQRYDSRSLNIFLEASAENSIPLSYVKWFYEDKRAALWLNMVLKKHNILTESIFIESDITIFVHNVIYNKHLFIRGRSLQAGHNTDNESLVSEKKVSLNFLKEAYFRNKVDPRDVKWLIDSNSSKISYLYQYMRKKHDINNLLANKEKRKNEKELTKNIKKNLTKGESKEINKDGYKEALICSDTIFFKAADTTSRLDHILASLDYWRLDDYWFDITNVILDEQKINSRALFIKNMYDAWNAKQKRDRDKIKKEQGINLTSDNKKNLKYLAKAYGKTQREVLNDLVESAYGQMMCQEIQLDPPFPNQFKAFDEIPLVQPSNLQSEHTEREAISDDTSLTKDKQESSSEHDVYSTGSQTYDNGAFFNNIPQTQPSSSQSKNSEKLLISEETSRIDDKGEPNNTCDDLLGHSTPHLNKFVLNDAVETSHNRGLVQPFFPQQSRDEQTIDEECPFERNSRFITDKRAGRPL